MKTNHIYTGDCLKIMKGFEDNCIDSIVTDPPYELGFMGKKWDNTGIANNVEMWKECLRVLKPGGHLLSFGGTRTYHRMAVAIEDAGFEIRDMIEWVYGSGFPKSYNIGKAVDKIAPRLGQFDEFAKHLTEQIKKSGKSQKEIAQLFPSKTGGLTGCVWNWANGANVPTVVQWNILKPLLNLSDEFLPLIKRIEREREVVGKDGRIAKDSMFGVGIQPEWDITKGTSEWEGWGTALKPAHEPICMARKPLAEKTVAENCLKWGTGGINIDKSRVENTGKSTLRPLGKSAYQKGGGIVNGGVAGTREVESEFGGGHDGGRFPANLIHDNSKEVRECFPETKSGVAVNRNRGERMPSTINYANHNGIDIGFNDSGNASRFFKSIKYCPKASKAERNKGCEGLEEKDASKMSGGEETRADRPTNHPMRTNYHPTVKPIALMEYLIKMVTPKKGIVLDPFLGSGTTAIAARKLFFKYVGIEQNPDYVKIAKARLSQGVLF